MAAVAQAVEVDQEVVRIVINERGEVSREEKRIQKGNCKQAFLFSIRFNDQINTN